MLTITAGNAYCNNCKREFSIFKGTIFEETRMPLRLVVCY